MKKTIILALIALTIPLSVKAQLNTLKLEKDTYSGYSDIRCIDGKDYCYLIRNNSSQINTKDLSTIDKTGKLIGTISISNEYDVELDNEYIYITTKLGVLIDIINNRSLKKVNVPISTNPKINLMNLFTQPRKVKSNISQDQINAIKKYLTTNIEVLKNHKEYLGPSFIKMNDTYYATMINKETKEANIIIIDKEIKTHRLYEVDYSTFNPDTHIVEIYLDNQNDKLKTAYLTSGKCDTPQCNTRLYFQTYKEEIVPDKKEESNKKPNNNKKEEKKDEDPRKGFAITLTIGGVLLALAIIAYILAKKSY